VDDAATAHAKDHFFVGPTQPGQHGAQQREHRRRQRDLVGEAEAPPQGATLAQEFLGFDGDVVNDAGAAVDVLGRGLFTQGRALDGAGGGLGAGRRTLTLDGALTLWAALLPFGGTGRCRRSPVAAGGIELGDPALATVRTLIGALIAVVGTLLDARLGAGVWTTRLHHGGAGDARDAGGAPLGASLHLTLVGMLAAQAIGLGRSITTAFVVGDGWGRLGWRRHAGAWSGTAATASNGQLSDALAGNRPSAVEPLAEAAMTTKKPSTSATAMTTTTTTTTTTAPSRWSKDMVARAAPVFAELPHLPSWDTQLIAERVAAWYRFVDVVAAGLVDVDGLPLAGDIVRFGADFLTDHPEHVLVAGASWQAEDVEAVARWFGGIGPRRGAGADVVARVDAFERVVRSRLVVDEALPLARVLVEAMEGWRAVP
jgi:hypothetical protein